MNDVAVILNKQCEYEEAQILRERLLKLNRTVLGEEHPDTIKNMGYLVDVLTAQDKYEEAKGLCRHALDLMKKIFGNTDLETLDSKEDMAQSRDEEAEDIESQRPVLRDAPSCSADQEQEEFTAVVDTVPPA